MAYHTTTLPPRRERPSKTHGKRGRRPQARIQHPQRTPRWSNNQQPRAGKRSKTIRRCGRTYGTPYKGGDSRGGYYTNRLHAAQAQPSETAPQLQLRTPNNQQQLDTNSRLAEANTKSLAPQAYDAVTTRHTKRRGPRCYNTSRGTNAQPRASAYRLNKNTSSPRWYTVTVLPFSTA